MNLDLPDRPPATRARALRASFARSRLALAAVTLAASLAVALAHGAEPGAEKKLIEYGWDVPTPQQMRGDLAAMERRPFDGLIFRLAGGHNAFVTQLLDRSKFAADEQALRELKFGRFSDNFVLIWGSPPADFDWFNDDQWQAIAANARLLVEVALPGRPAGICFDPEPYDFSLWDYAKQPQAKSHPFADYRAKVRQRGGELMRAFEARMPGPTLLTFFHVSFFDRFATLPEAERSQRLERESWGLMPDFFVGMLEAASDKARFIDGNENAYYYTSREQYFRAYQAIRRRALGLIPPDLRDKYERLVRVGQALYVDQNFALRQPNTEKYLSWRMTPAEQARWFEYNTYWALYTSDEYVWCYSERMNWWKDQVPAGLEAAIVSAREKIAAGKPLGFEIEPLIAAAGKREWVSLFNGKDLTGWTPRGKAAWSVQDGAIVGVGGMGHLYSDVACADFEAKGQFRITSQGASANSGFYFRAHPPADDVDGFPRGYEAQICNSGDAFTGWLWKPGTPTGKATELLAKDGEWFDYRIRAVGPHIQIWVNEKLVMTHDDAEYQSGHFAIQGHNPGMKIEARELFYRNLNP